MPIEYVPIFDENGEDVGGYTESVPDTYVKEEPDCFSCNDRGCRECDGSQIPDTQTVKLGGGWGPVHQSQYSDEPPF